MTGKLPSIVAALFGGFGIAASAAPVPETPVVELRQYKIVRGQRDALIALFEREFIESQEAVGMRLIGQFRDHGDADRFTWVREFPGMAAREKALAAFYSGSVWAAHRNSANPMLEDNDNVLLLRPAAPGLSLAPSSRPARARTASKTGDGVIVATIHYLWKDPGQGFTKYFTDEMMPRLHAAGLPVIGAYVPERTPNNFPGLPVRQSENVFVWFTRVESAGQLAAVQQSLLRSDAVLARLRDYEERTSQQLLLEPTARSALR